MKPPPGAGEGAGPVLEGHAGVPQVGVLEGEHFVAGGVEGGG